MVSVDGGQRLMTGLNPVGFYFFTKLPQKQTFSSGKNIQSIRLQLLFFKIRGLKLLSLRDLDTDLIREISSRGCLPINFH